MDEKDTPLYRAVTITDEGTRYRGHALPLEQAVASAWPLHDITRRALVIPEAWTPDQHNEEHP